MGPLLGGPDGAGSCPRCGIRSCSPALSPERALPAEKTFSNRDLREGLDLDRRRCHQPASVSFPAASPAPPPLGASLPSHLLFAVEVEELRPSGNSASGAPGAAALAKSRALLPCGPPTHAVARSVWRMDVEFTDLVYGVWSSQRGGARLPRQAQISDALRKPPTACMLVRHCPPLGLRSLQASAAHKDRTCRSSRHGAFAALPNGTQSRVPYAVLFAHTISRAERCLRPLAVERGRKKQRRPALTPPCASKK